LPNLYSRVGYGAPGQRPTGADRHQRFPYMATHPLVGTGRGKKSRRTRATVERRPPQPGPDSAAHAPAWPAPPASRGTAPPNVRPRRRGLHLGPRRRRPPTGVTPDSLARYHPLRLPVTGLPPRIIIATTLSTPILLPPLHPLFGGLRTGRRPFLPLTAYRFPTLIALNAIRPRSADARPSERPIAGFPSVL
jgi:hypothetical protein